MCDINCEIIRYLVGDLQNKETQKKFFLSVTDWPPFRMLSFLSLSLSLFRLLPILVCGGGGKGNDFGDS